MKNIKSDSEELKEFMDSSSDERQGLYDTLRDPTLLKLVNSWMFKNSATNRSPP